VLGRDSAIVTLFGDTIAIRRPNLVLRQIWLQPAESGECEPEEEEYCADLRNDPIVVGIPLAHTAELRSTAPAKLAHTLVSSSISTHWIATAMLRCNVPPRVCGHLGSR
jgi:hypothetical protein